jgi:hypothetical protein
MQPPFGPNTRQPLYCSLIATDLFLCVARTLMQRSALKQPGSRQYSVLKAYLGCVAGFERDMG